MLAELVIAAAVVVMLLGSVFSLVDPARGALAVQPHVAEQQQRLRAGFWRLQSDLLLAGSGPHPTVDASVARLRAPVIPALIGDRQPLAAGATFATDAVTVLYSPARGAALLASPLAGGDPDLRLAPAGSGCRRPGRTTCAFEADSLALVFDAEGRSDILRVTQVFDEALRVRAVGGGPPRPFAAGASIAPLVVRAYYHDRAAAQLRFQDGWRTDVPVLDNVVGLSLRYFGGGAPPPNRDDGGGPLAACLRNRPQPLAAAPPGQALGAAQLADGPRCGGRLPYDVDLFRIRRVRVEIRLQVSSALLRGRDPALFVRPGSARAGGRRVPDLSAVFDVTPRSVSGG